VIKSKTYKLDVIPYILMCSKFSENFDERGMDAISNAKAGVGKPEKLFSCLLILKIERRIAEKTIIIKAMKGKISSLELSLIKFNIIKAGAIPKVTRSEKESICTPNSD